MKVQSYHHMEMFWVLFLVYNNIILQCLLKWILIVGHYLLNYSSIVAYFEYAASKDGSGHIKDSLYV